MTLSEHYLDAVRGFLPRGVPREDILAEISEHLQSTIEEREARLGRRLTEREQEEVLNDYGSPMIVAGRYGSGDRRLAFGGALIGPEIFPLYVRVLILNWCIGVAIHAVLAFALERPAGLWPFLSTIGCQFVGLTVVFSIIDRLQRRSKQKWYFPPAYLQPIPRWQSASGLLVCTAMLAWWIMVGFARPPLRDAAEMPLEFAPGWYALYWSVILFLAAGIVQRAVNLARPDWNWLHYGVRLATNALALVALYFVQSQYPFIVLTDSATASDHTLQSVAGLNDLIWWALVGIAPFYFLTNAAINAWFSAQHICYAMRQRGARVSA
jgi:hypothetical protein